MMNRPLLGMQLPPDLFLDLLHVLTHAVELDFDRLRLPEHKMTARQKESLKCLKGSVADHRRRCRDMGVTEADYDEEGLQGEDREPWVLMMVRLQSAVTRLELESLSNAGAPLATPKGEEWN